MAFVKPTLNILFNYWERDDWGFSGETPTAPTYANLAGQLRPNAKNFTVISSILEGSSTQELCLPASPLMNMPSWQDGDFPSYPDIVEVPSGSKRWYFIIDLEYVGKGFMNENRVALIVKTSTWDYWNQYGSPNWPYTPPWPQT